MDRVIIEFFDNRKEGVSRFNAPPLTYTVGKREDGSASIMITCPQGHFAYLEHQINEKGEVHPSIVCPEQPNEHWHIWGILKDWKQGFKRSE